MWYTYVLSNNETVLFSMFMQASQGLITQIEYLPTVFQSGQTLSPANLSQHV
jgi:hypothetical protein